MKTCGIYLITVQRPGLLPVHYVGQSVCIEKRLVQHTQKLACGSHPNARMQSCYNKYGGGSFSFDILEECQRSELNRFEQWWLDEMVGYRRVLNFGVVATSGMAKRNHSPESKARMSAAHKGKKLSAEHVKKIADKNRGKRISDQERLFRSINQKGKSLTEEHRQALADAKKGKEIPNTQRQKMIKGLPRGDDHPARKNAENHPLHKPVIAVCKETGKVLTFKSLKHAGVAGFNPATISSVCSGRLKSHKGYKWSFIHQDRVSPLPVSPSLQLD